MHVLLLLLLLYICIEGAAPQTHDNALLSLSIPSCHSQRKKLIAEHGNYIRFMLETNKFRSMTKI